jgi:hypothetical protein
MRISPEPLHPLRCWRELWQSKPFAGGDNLNKPRVASESGQWKTRKRPAGFQWFTHLFFRNPDR